MRLRKNDRTDHDGQFYDDSDKIGDSSDRNEPYQRAVSDTGLRDL